MHALVEDFLLYLRQERGQAAHTQRNYAYTLNRFVAWAEKQNLHDWRVVKLNHLMAFLEFERGRELEMEPRHPTRRSSRPLRAQDRCFLNVMLCSACGS